jgi:hypothetical protein
VTFTKRISVFSGKKNRLLHPLYNQYNIYNQYNGILIVLIVSLVRERGVGDQPTVFPYEGLTMVETPDNGYSLGVAFRYAAPSGTAIG